MTTEAATTVSTPEPTSDEIAALGTKVTEATANLTTVQTSAMSAMQAAMKEGASGLSKIQVESVKVADAQRQLDVATAALENATKASRWENLLPARKPIEDAIRSLLIESINSTPWATVHGVITVGTPEIPAVAEVKVDGKVTVAAVAAQPADPHRVTVSFKPVLAELDVSDLEAQIADAVESEAFASTNVKSLDFNVTNIGTPTAMLQLVPTNMVTAAARNKPSKGTSSDRGSWEYLYEGKVLGSKEFLIAIKASGHSIVTERKQGFDTALDADKSGYGMSNLAKQVADALSVTRRQKVATR